MKKTLIATIITLSLSLGMGFATPAYAAGCPAPDSKNSPKEQVQVGIGATGNDCSGSGVTDFVATIVEILSIVIGIAAVIMILVAGFKYMTSAGDSGKVSSAKSTLIYALVGLLIAALAQVLVRFVLNFSKL